MDPSLAADQDLAGTPVDVVEPERMDLLAPQAEPCQQQHDGAVAAPGRAFAVHGGDQSANLPGRKVARRTVLAPGRGLRHTWNQIAAGQPGGEHEPEHAAEICRLLIQTLPAPRNNRGQGKEGADVLRPDTVQVAGFRPEKEDQKALEEQLAFADRGPAQPPLQAQPVAIVRAQPLKSVRRRRRFRRRHDAHADADKMIDEPGEACASGANRVPRTWRRHGVLHLRQAKSVNVAGTKPADRSLFPKQVDRMTKMMDRAGGVAEPLKFGQKPLPVRDQPVVGACRGAQSRPVCIVRHSLSPFLA